LLSTKIPADDQVMKRQDSFYDKYVAPVFEPATDAVAPVVNDTLEAVDGSLRNATSAASMFCNMFSNFRLTYQLMTSISPETPTKTVTVMMMRSDHGQ
jgi:hypothetical protein